MADIFDSTPFYAGVTTSAQDLAKTDDKDALKAAVPEASAQAAQKAPAIGESPFPTEEEREQFSIKAYRGIEVGLGTPDSLAKHAAQLAERYPDHLVLVQSGSFLHGYDKSAYALHVLKNYKLKLVGTQAEPNLRVGFPVGQFKRRLWPFMAEFGVPYVVALGSKQTGFEIYHAEMSTSPSDVMRSIDDNIIKQTLFDLQQRDEVMKANAKALITNSDAAEFKLKSVAQELDTLLLRDLAKLPRDHRAIVGENIRACMHGILNDVFRYGLAENKRNILFSLSGRIDLLKHYLIQVKQLNLPMKASFAQRAGLAVELGKLTGGLIRR